MAGKMLQRVFALLVWVCFPLLGLAAAPAAAASEDSACVKAARAQKVLPDEGLVLGTISILRAAEVDALKLDGIVPDACKVGSAREVLNKFRGGASLSDDEKTVILRGLGNDDLRQMESKQSTFCATVRPQIHTIGWQSQLPYESMDGVRPAGNERSMRIQVQGRDLYPMCVRVDVQLTGTVPVSRFPTKVIEGTDQADSSADYYVNYPDKERSSSINIVLLKPYLDRVQTGDKLTVIVQVTPRADAYAEQTKRAPVFFSRRTFTLYSTADFRQILLQRIQPDNFVAFPLPDDEAKVLFGSYVRDNYYVVQLSVRNTGGDSKVISTGMIRANGTAVISPEDGSFGGYSVPLVVAPQSLQQVYKAMTTKDQFLTRAWVFRSLEFGGVLATGLTGVVNFGAQAVKGIGLFTGVALPEGKKLWPDTLGDHQENLVNFGMPELIKVAPNAVVDNRFLFFPKKEIMGALVDPSRPTESNANRARLVEVRFDDLDIRFETVAAMGSTELRSEAFSTSVALDTQITKLRQYALWVSTAAAKGDYGNLSAAQYVDVVANTSRVKGLGSWDADQQAQIKLIEAYLAAIKGDSASKLFTDLYADGSEYSESGLQKARETLKTLSLTINSGTSGEDSMANVKSIKAKVATSEAIQAFYIKTGSVLIDLNKHLVNVKDKADTAKNSAEFAEIKKLLASLSSSIPSLATKIE